MFFSETQCSSLTRHFADKMIRWQWQDRNSVGNRTHSTDISRKYCVFANKLSSTTWWLKKVSCYHSTTAYFFWATLYTL